MTTEQIADFGGYATVYNVKCTDGRTITEGAFKHQDGIKVPVVWQHLRNSPENILGYAVLEHKSKGVYARVFLNNSESAQAAKERIEHGDITNFSIYANQLVEKHKMVDFGVIKEVALVVSGANPGAKIDYINIVHGEEEYISDDEAIIYTNEVIEHLSADDTIADIWNTLNPDQKELVYTIVGQVVSGDEEVEQSSIIKNEDDDDEYEKENNTQNTNGGSTMKKNAFTDNIDPNEDKTKELVHKNVNVNLKADGISFKALNERAYKLGSLREAYLEHAGTYGIGSDRTNLELLFPDAKSATDEPTWISRDMDWVAVVLNGTRHRPFSRIKSLHFDITADEARALGYVTGNLKVEEVFPVLRRITTPHTIYKKQKLDRDDILDITDFDVVRMLKQEMRLMLNEEIARAILVGDGRDPVTEVDDHIPTDKVRPVWGDSSVYTYHKQVVVGRTTDEMIDDMLVARANYRGSGNPVMFCAPTFLTAMLLLKDTTDRRLYRNVRELADELRVRDIIEVPIMEGLQRTDTVDYNLRAIQINLNDYTIGADRGGEINFFDDFDIDYNQFKYLIETRVSGALTVPGAAIVLEQAVS